MPLTTRRRAARYLSALSLLTFVAHPEGLPAADSVARPDATVRELMARDLEGDGLSEAQMLTVEYAGGGASMPHRHNAQVFVYVLQGSVRMQIEGSPEVLLHQDETFYEGSSDVHLVSANADASQPARLLVFIVKPKKPPASQGMAR